MGVQRRAVTVKGFLGHWRGGDATQQSLEASAQVWWRWYVQNIIRSYREAGLLAVARLKAQATDIGTQDDAKRRDMMIKCAMTSMNSKLVGCQPVKNTSTMESPYSSHSL